MFKETVLVGKSAEPLPGPFWELTSDLVLPRLANTRQLIYGYNSAPFDGDYSKVLILTDGFYTTAEYHYRASDLRAIEPFDVAVVSENLGGFPDKIVSRRFYEFCKKEKLRMEWVPVRIDPD